MMPVQVRPRTWQVVMVSRQAVQVQMQPQAQLVVVPRRAVWMQV